jgi:hypothetical protein
MMKIRTIIIIIIITVNFINIAAAIIIMMIIIRNCIIIITIREISKNYETAKEKVRETAKKVQENLICKI